jgi:hypothetical protein
LIGEGADQSVGTTATVYLPDEERLAIAPQEQDAPLSDDASLIIFYTSFASIHVFCHRE